MITLTLTHEQAHAMKMLADKHTARPSDGDLMILVGDAIEKALPNASVGGCLYVGTRFNVNMITVDTEVNLDILAQAVLDALKNAGAL